MPSVPMARAARLSSALPQDWKNPSSEVSMRTALVQCLLTACGEGGPHPSRLGEPGLVERLLMPGGTGQTLADLLADGEQVVTGQDAPGLVQVAVPPAEAAADEVEVGEQLPVETLGPGHTLGAARTVIRHASIVLMSRWLVLSVWARVGS